MCIAMNIAVWGFTPDPVHQPGFFNDPAWTFQLSKNEVLYPRNQLLTDHWLIISYLLGGLEHVFHILGMSSSQPTFIFFRGVGQPPITYHVLLNLVMTNSLPWKDPP